MEAAGAGVAGSHSHSSGAGAERPGSGIGGLGLSPGYVALSPANLGPGSVCASLRLSFCICQPGRSWQLPPQGGREGRWLGRSLWSCACVPWCPIEGHPYPPPPVPSPGVGPWPGFSTGPAPHKGTLGFLCPPPQRPQGMGWLYPRTLGTPSCREAVRLTWGSTPRAPRSSRSPERGSAGARFRPSRRRLRASGDPLNDWPPGGHSYWLSRRN